MICCLTELSMFPKTCVYAIFQVCLSLSYLQFKLWLERRKDDYYMFTQVLKGFKLIPIMRRYCTLIMEIKGPNTEG